MRHYFRHIALAFACMLSLSTLAQTTQWRDIYTAKKKDTIFGIARKYNITVDELVEANPAMKGDGYKLKKGEIWWSTIAASSWLATACGGLASRPTSARGT